MGRSTKKGPFINAKLIGKVNKMIAAGEKKGIKTWAPACTILPLVPRICGKMIEKALKSAAHNLSIKSLRAGKPLVPQNVFVKECWSTMGPMGQMKRAMPAPMGRANTFKRKVCHLTVIVSDE